MKLLVASIHVLLLLSQTRAADITFTYSGTGGNTQTTATGSFSFTDPKTTTLSLSDITVFSLQQTVRAGSLPVVGIFDFTKADLTAFTVSLSNGQVTDAMFQTVFKPQTSSPTNTEFKPQRFIDLSLTQAKTEYQDTGGFITTDTQGSIQFSSVPEPSSALLFLSALMFAAIRRRPNQAVQ